MKLAIDAAKRVELELGDTGVDAHAAAAEDPRCRDKNSREVLQMVGNNF